MPNYARGKIYKLTDGVRTYVGSTTEKTLAHRKAQHVSKSKQYPDRKLYKYMAEVGWDSMFMVLLEEFACETKDQLRAREQFWADQLQADLNAYRVQLTDEQRAEAFRQRYLANKAAYLERIRNYKNANIDKIKAYNSAPMSCNVCGKTMQRQSLYGHVRRVHAASQGATITEAE